MKIKNNILYADFWYNKSYRYMMLVLAFFALNILNGCKKLITPNPSTTAILSSTVYTDSVTAQAAVAGLYTTLLSATTYNADISTICGFTADELNYVGSSYTQYINNTIPTNDPIVGTMWSSSYNIIYIANSIISGITAGTDLSTAFKNRSIGEALFIRSFCYFYLINLFGDVPLILGTNLGTNSSIPRISADSVYSQIIHDLKLAQSYLPSDYSFVTGSARTRVNKFAATALLARVYLYRNDWVDAEAQATTVINSSLFSLSPNLSQTFTPTSPEAIFQFYNSLTGYTYYAAEVLPNPVSLVPTFTISDRQKGIFEDGDIRKTNWTGYLLYNDSTYYYPAKYKSITTGANVEYYTVLRLSEQYLIRAEARAEQNNISGAIADLDSIHNPLRIGLPLYSGITDQSNVLNAIMKERQLELFSEWGNRWFDLKRTHNANAVLGAEKSTWVATDTLYPIPITEITANPNLTQNPGYN